jgi:uncharacterized protein YcfJ
MKATGAVVGALGLVMATSAVAQVTFYEREGFRGRSFVADDRIWNLERSGFDDRASSAIVDNGTWQVCTGARFEGECRVLRPGEYPSLGAMGMNDRISSVRPLDRVSESRDGPPPRDDRAYAYAPRAGERLYQADVTAVRAVVGPPEQRCWVEQQQVVRSGGDNPNVPGAVIGGVVGGVLGHQIGGGRGKDVATALGAIGGAAIGANTGRGGGGEHVVTQDVQRCAHAQGPLHPDYYDVTYVFRGREHRVQMASAPGSTITVNGEGEPRG